MHDEARARGRALSAGAFEPCSNYSNASNFSNNFSCSSVQSRFSPAIGRHPNPGQCLTRFHRARDVRSKRVALNRAAASAAANKCQPHPERNPTPPLPRSKPLTIRSRSLSHTFSVFLSPTRFGIAISATGRESGATKGDGDRTLWDPVRGRSLGSYL